MGTSTFNTLARLRGAAVGLVDRHFRHEMLVLIDTLLLLRLEMSYQMQTRPAGQCGSGDCLLRMVGRGSPGRVVDVLAVTRAGLLHTAEA